MKLWDISGEMLWEPGERRFVSALKEHVSPTFSEDGKYLGVFLGSSVEIVDARWATSSGIISIGSTDISPSSESTDLNGLNVKAIAVFENGRSLAACFPGQDGDDIVLTKLRFRQQGSGTKPVDIVRFYGVSQVGIVYLAKGCRLIFVGKLDNPNQALPPMIGVTWDVRTRVKLQVFKFGQPLVLGHQISLNAPLYVVNLNSGPSLVVHTGHQQGNIQSSVDFFTADGRHLHTFNDQTRGVYCFVSNGILIFSWDGKVKYYKYSSSKSDEVAKLDGDEVPCPLEVKGLAVSDDRITLILDNSRFISFRNE